MAVAVIAVAGTVIAVTVSFHGGAETPQPAPYDYVDVLSVFNATGVPDGMRTGGGLVGPSREFPDGYYATVQGGGNWSADVFEDAASAAAEEKFLAESMRESLAARRKMLATNTTEPQWLPEATSETSSAAQRKLVATTREPKWSLARCANVVVGGIGDEPERVCRALAVLPQRFRLPAS